MKITSILKSASAMAPHLAMIATLSMIGAHAALARSHAFTLLHTFSGTDGAYPYSDLLADAAGNLYGTTRTGGDAGQGVIFKLAADGTETVLHSFTGGGVDGGTPYAPLVADAAGNLYGTTAAGGVGGSGVVFKLAPDGTVTALHAFAGGKDGAAPFAGLLADKDGNFYGTASAEGIYGGGLVFKLDTDGTYTVLYYFLGGSDGGEPVTGLIKDKAGNLYGTTRAGGANNGGVVYELTPYGSETVLHAFTGTPDGKVPNSRLVMDKSGNLYGTTTWGGTGKQGGYGTVYKITPDGTETVLHSFMGGKDSGDPAGDLLQDSAGNLYGTTEGGGANGRGEVFKLTPGGTKTVLYSFTGGRDGNGPHAGMITDKAWGLRGDLFGVTQSGGAKNGGTAFAIKK